MWGRSVRMDMRSLSGTGSAGMGCYPRYIPREESCLNQLPFSPWCVQACFLGESLPMLWKCEEASTEDASRPTAHPTTEGTKPQVTITYLTSTVRLIPGDACWMEANPFRGEREIESRWDEEDYEITRQVANGPSSYETKRFEQ